MQKIYLFIVVACILLSSCKTEKTEEYTESQEILNVSDTSAVIKELTGKIKSDPNNADLYIQRGNELLNRQKLTEANQDAERALKLDSTKSDAWLLAADISFLSKDIKNTVKFINSSLKFNEANIKALLKMAEIYFILEDYKQSMEYVNKALKIDVYEAKGYFIKGMNYKYMGDSALASSSFQTAIEQNPEYYDAYIQLGLLYADAKHPLAEQYYNNAIKLRPNSTEAIYNKSIFLQDNGFPERALEGYRIILEIDPQYSAAAFNIGYINLIFLKNYPEAITYFTKAISIYPDYYEAYYNRGYAYELSGDAKNAESDYRKSLAIQPDYTLAAKGVSRVLGEE